MIDEASVRDFLHERAEDVDPGDSSVDVRLAIQVGDQRRLRRRTVLAGGLVAVAVLVAGGATAIVRGTPEPSVLLPATGKAPARSEPLDPTVQRIGLRTPPEGPWQYSQELSTNRQQLTYFRTGPVAGAPGQTTRTDHVDVSLLTNAKLYGSIAQRGQPGPEVAGHRSYWVTKTEAKATLAFEWTPGGWATISATIEQTGAIDLVRSAAANVWLGARPVKLPFSMPRPAQQLKVLSVRSSIGPDLSVDADITFSDVPDGSDPATHVPRQLTVGTQKSPAGNTYKGSAANTTIGGHPAYLSTLDSSNTGDASEAMIFGISRQMLIVTVYDKATEKYVPRNQLRTFIGNVQLVTQPWNPTYWVNGLR
jgi:hypothetical protein